LTLVSDLRRAGSSIVHTVQELEVVISHLSPSAIPAPQGIVTVVVAPAPLAVTPAHTKSKVVTLVESDAHSSLVVIVDEPVQAGGIYGILCKFGYS